MEFKTTRKSVMFGIFVPEKHFKAPEDILSELDLDREQVVWLPLQDAQEANEAMVFEANPLVIINYDCQVSLSEECVQGKDVIDYSPGDMDAWSLVESYALSDFAHVHRHDEYSLRDGLGTAKQFYEIIEDRHWTYLPISNHGSVGGWMKKYVLAKEKGIKPIFGCEFYLNNYRKYTREEVKLFDDEMKLKYRKNNHQILIARTEEGWFNLITIHNDAQLNGFYYQPRTDHEFMSQYGKGIIATSTDGAAGELPQMLMREDLEESERFEKAKQLYDFYKNTFDEFYLELNLLRWDRQPEINRRLIKFGNWLEQEQGVKNLRYVITCDCHYLHPEDAETHDVLLMLRDNKTMSDKAVSYAAGKLKELLTVNGLCLDTKDPQWKEENELPKKKECVEEAIAFGRTFLEDNGYKKSLEEYNKKSEKAIYDLNLDPSKEDSVWEFSVRDLYIKDGNELYQTWVDLHGENDEYFTEEIYWRALRDTRHLARSVENFEIDTSIKLPQTENADEKLKELCLTGMQKYDFIGNQEYEDRLEHELEIIKGMGFSDYFLVFRKIVEFCQEKDIAIGPGRGSAAGSLVCYCLEITQIDPIKYGLLFSRFLDSSRIKDPPDIDCDFDKLKRGFVKEGMKEMFGENHVCAVGSYQLMKTKNVIKDVARVFNVDPAFVNSITKRLDGKYNIASDIEEEDDEEEGLDKIDWDKLVDAEPLLQNFFAEYPYVEQHCKKLRGQVRNIGQHPGGMIVASVDLFKWLPIRQQNENIVACWTEGLDFKELQYVGLVKYDVLGLTTVSIMDDAQHIIEDTTTVLNLDGNLDVRMMDNDLVTVDYDGDKYEVAVRDLEPGHVIIEMPTKMKKLDSGEMVVSHEKKVNKKKINPVTVYEKRKKPFVLRNIPMHDKTSLKRLSNLDVFGIFQFETPVAVQVMREIGIDSFADMYAATTLGRPDPLSGKLHQRYGARKRGEEGWEPIEVLDDTLSETFLLPIYQEQSMSFAAKIAGFSDKETNSLRKGLAKGKDSEAGMKKLQSILEDLKNRAEPAVEKGDISREQLDYLLSIIEKFGGYGFNKSLSFHNLVKTKNRGDVMIKDIKAGDVVYTWNGVDTDESEVVALHDHGWLREFKVVFENGQHAACSINHKFRTKKGMVPLYQIIQEDLEVMYYNSDNKQYEYLKMIDIEHWDKRHMYDIEVDHPAHNFQLANGIVTSNSHAVSYAMIAYWSLFMKTHFPGQFICGLFNFTEKDAKDKKGNTHLANYVRYARQRGIEVLPPDINESKIEFTFDGAAIRWGLGKVKNLGDKATQEIIKHQPYSGLEDLLEKVEKRQVNKSKVEALVRCGAFDKFGSREYILNKYFIEVRKEKNFEAYEIDEKTMEADEMELLGVCLSFKEMPDIDPAWYQENDYLKLNQTTGLSQGTFVCKIKEIVSKRSKSSNKPMLIVSAADDTSDHSFYVWEKSITQFEEIVKQGSIIVVPLKKFDDGDAWFFSGQINKLKVVEFE